MELRYEIAEEHLRIFVAALHCLAQVGKEVSIECEGTTTLTCRALNDAHSASGQIAFDRSFFTTVGMHYDQDNDDEDDEDAVCKRAALQRFTPFVKCKVYAKSCCNIFRTLKHVRSVQLAFRLDDQAALTELQQQQQTTNDDEEEELDVDCVEIVWRLSCDFEITKTHRMKVHTCQVMRAVFDREHCANRLVTRQYHLASLLGHIHHSTEVCVTCSSTHVKFESYVANAGDGEVSVCFKKSGAFRCRIDVAGQVFCRDHAVHGHNVPPSVIPDSQPLESIVVLRISEEEMPVFHQVLAAGGEGKCRFNYLCVACAPSLFHLPNEPREGKPFAFVFPEERRAYPGYFDTEMGDRDEVETSSSAQESSASASSSDDVSDDPSDDESVEGASSSDAFTSSPPRFRRQPALRMRRD
ncbi:Cell cycle checkpoint control protein rad9b-like, partial [Globisporangium splendens]